MIDTRKIPAAIEAEQGVIGGVMVAPDAWAECSDLMATDFLVPAHQVIWDAMRSLASRSMPIDVLLILDLLTASGELGKLDGGAAYLSRLNGFSWNVAHYTMQVRDASAKRRLLMALSGITSRIYEGDEDASTLSAAARDAINKASANVGELTSFGQLNEGIMQEIERRAQAGESFVTGARFGIQKLDNLTAGLQPGWLTIVAAETGGGKCLGIGTKVMKFNGSVVAVEDVSAGDELMGPDSKPRRVLATTRGRGAMFRIIPTKGEAWTCNDVHVMTTVHSATSEVTDTPLDAFLRQDKTRQKHSKLFRVGVEFKRGGELTVDPYFLGMVIGDGSVARGGVRVCKPDKEIALECRRQAERWGLRYRLAEYEGSTPYHCLVVDHGGEKVDNPLFVALRGLGLETACAEKRVPSAYLTASREARLQLLAGLIDTDGSLGHGFDWISASPGLAGDVVFLARSLGLAAYVTECRKGCQTGAVGTYFRVSISGHIDTIPTRIPRKQAPPRQQIKDALRTGFTVEPISEGDYAGFELDGDGRFLLGDFTVTHNTALAMQAAINVVLAGGTALACNLEMTKSELAERALVHVAEINSQLVRTGQIQLDDWPKMHDAARKLYETRFYFEDATTSVASISSKARLWRSRNRGMLGLLVVDFVQLIRGAREKGQSRAQEVGIIAQDLKALAKELGVPVILISQLNRAGVKADRPSKSDLKESGDLENAADLILLPWNKNETSDGDVAIIVDKFRSGERITIPARWVGRHYRFADSEYHNWQEAFDGAA